jgi:hypothetical protein
MAMNGWLLEDGQLAYGEPRYLAYLAMRGDFNLEGGKALKITRLLSILGFAW